MKEKIHIYYIQYRITYVTILYIIPMNILRTSLRKPSLRTALRAPSLQPFVNGARSARAARLCCPCLCA